MINPNIPLFLWIILLTMYNNILMFSLIITSATCAIGPSVNTLKAHLIFPSKFAIYLNL